MRPRRDLGMQLPFLASFAKYRGVRLRRSVLNGDNRYVVGVGGIHGLKHISKLHPCG